MKENKNQSKIKQRLKNHRKDQYTKSWLFEKTNKLVNLQPNSSGKKKERERERTQRYKIRHEIRRS